MRYRCLVLDHDDTLVESTACIHYPSFCAYLKLTRPDAHYTLEDYFRKNFDPGILPLFTEELGFTQQEVDDEFRFWQDFVKGRIPAAFPGIREILEQFRRQGGLLTVVSHSVSEVIRRDFQANSLPMPDRIYGWELPPEQRKPSPYALQSILRDFELRPEEVLVIDDLKPGYDMARQCGVPFAASGWAYDVPEIEAFMRRNCDFYFKTVEAFGKFLFDT